MAKKQKGLTKEEVKELRGLYSVVNDAECFGTRDLRRIAELEGKATEKQLERLNPELTLDGIVTKPHVVSSKKVFFVRRPEVWMQTVQIEATSKEEALRLVREELEGEVLESVFTYSYTIDDVEAWDVEE